MKVLMTVVKRTTWLHAVIAAILSFASVSAASAAAVTVNVNKQLNPSNTILRGDLFRGNQNRDARIDLLAQNGFKAACFHLELNVENQLFSKSGGTITHKQHAVFNSNRKRAVSKGMTVFAQATGTPHVFKPDPKYTWHGGANYYPLPKPGEFNQLANVVSAWMNKGNSVAKSVWLGTQEPIHTIGFEGGTKTEAGKKKNLQRYADIWSRIAKKLNGKSGAMQLNGMNNDNQPYPVLAADALNSHNTPMNYWSVQNYIAERNSSVIAGAKEALKHCNAGKIIFNRYGYNKPWADSKKFDRSEGIVTLLQAEDAILKNSDKVTGYCLMHEGFSKYNMVQKVGKFLNEMPPNRRDASSNNNNIQVFATSNNSKLRIAVWNKGSASQNVNITIKGKTWNNSTLKIHRGTAGTFGTINGTYNPSNGKISGFSLNGKAFALIRLGS